MPQIQLHSQYLITQVFHHHLYTQKVGPLKSIQFILRYLLICFPFSSAIAQKSESESQLPASLDSCVIRIEDSINRSEFDDSLPTVGILTFEGVLMTEVTAPIDVFSKSNSEGKKLFNVVLVARSINPVAMETGMRVLPDFTLNDCPDLDVLIVPSSYDMAQIIDSQEILQFVQTKDRSSKYTMSNCAGAYLIGASGVGDGKKIVTYVGGGKELQSNFPKLSVQDDRRVSFVKDGKLVSSNGNLASYISALEVLESLTDKNHREHVERSLYLERLRNHSH